MRRTEIDGIRGWAAVVVLFYHLIWEFFGAALPEYRSPTLHALLDGDLAVFVFFVLSGDALSLSYTRSGGPGPSMLVIAKRYFRLAGPIFLSCLVTYLLMRSGLTFNAEAASIVDRPDWLGFFLSFAPSFSAMVDYSLIGVFGPTDASTSYNPFMWPMRAELIGSMIVLFLGYLPRHFRYFGPLLVGAAIGLCVLGSYLSLFLIGIIFGYLRDRGLFAWLQSNRPANRVFCCAAFLALFWMDREPQRIGLTADDLRLFSAPAFVFVCYASGDVVSLMRTRVSSYLGKISFPVYYIQFAVIVSWTSGCVVYARAAQTPLEWAAPVIIVTSVLVTLFAAICAEALETRFLGWLNAVAAMFVQRSGLLQEAHAKR